MHKTALTALVMLTFLSACTSGRVNDVTFCSTAHPIYMSPGDQVSADTGRQILSHDETGQILCGWEK